MMNKLSLHRRQFLHVAGAGLAGAALVRPAFAAQAPAVQTRTLTLFNLHTGDTFTGAYWDKGAFVPDAAAEIARVMRDHRNNEIHDIDPHLFDVLSDLGCTLETKAPFQIISGYRSPASNAALHEASDGVATHSLHMDGKAIDIRVKGVACEHLRDAALSLQRGGVGFYPASDFVHVDTGRIRRW
jgi:uncharacterized protein YcbK (DUF882 family)